MSSTEEHRAPADMGTRKLLTLLSSLTESRGGKILYQQIERLLQASAQENLEQQQAYARLLDLLLEGMAQGLASDSDLRLYIKMLQVRLQPPLTATETQAIAASFQDFQAQLPRGGKTSEELLRQQLSPLLKAFDLAVKAVAQPPAHPAAETKPVEPPRTHVLEDERPTPAFEQAPGQKINSVYRHHLNEQQKSIQQLENDLLNKIRSIQKSHNEFSSTLGKALQEARSTTDVADIHRIRETIVKDAEDMARGNEMLAETLDSAYHFLKTLQKDGQRMSDELARVHLLSLTDELTGLPNRRAFLRHLDDEISRSKRYDFPLSIAVIDLDHFKSVNDRFGHSVGDAVLRNYAKNIFTVLRHHDIVARFGGEEFALMLPNTSLDNGMAALNKVLLRARDSRFIYKDTEYTVPTMSAGLVQYQSGESVSAMIERADNALYRAKERGRNRIVSEPEIKAAEVSQDHRPPEDETHDDLANAENLITWSAADS